MKKKIEVGIDPAYPTNAVTIEETEREVYPERGDRPGPNEVGFIRCENGHLGPFMLIDEEVDFDGPKGQYAQYCVSCINLWVIQQAGLRPAKFYIRKQLVRPVSQIILPGDYPRG